MREFIITKNKDYKVIFSNGVCKYYYYKKNVIRKSNFEPREVDGVNEQPTLDDPPCIYEGFNYHELDDTIIDFGKYESFEDDDNPVTWEYVCDTDPQYFGWIASKRKGNYKIYYDIKTDNKIVCKRCYMTESELFLNSEFCFRCLKEKNLKKISYDK